MTIRSIALAGIAVLLASCGENDPERENPGSMENPARTDTASACTNAQCDASTPTIPAITATGGSGDVTVYGGIGYRESSSGGACNYGVTGIVHYAAIHVNLLPGDLRGQWNGGRVCGQCVRIRARTSTGWRSTHARIVDKCPDDHCGIDLGGAPATEIMGIQPGRYAGEWSFVSCEGLADVYDDSTSLWVKEGSNAWWSLVQVRNPPSAVDSMMVRPQGGAWSALAWATEAENFFKVPREILSMTDSVQVRVVYRMAPPDTVRLVPADLTRADSSYKLRRAARASARSRLQPHVEAELALALETARAVEGVGFHALSVAHEHGLVAVPRPGHVRRRFQQRRGDPLASPPRVHDHVLDHGEGAQTAREIGHDHQTAGAHDFARDLRHQVGGARIGEDGPPNPSGLDGIRRRIVGVQQGHQRKDGGEILADRDANRGAECRIHPDHLQFWESAERPATTGTIPRMRQI